MRACADARSPVRHLQRLDVRAVEDGCGHAGMRVVRVTLEADFFLYRMCRRLVCILVAVGRGQASTPRGHSTPQISVIKDQGIRPRMVLSV